MRCLADAIPKTANPETMLTTASVTSNCIIEKPRWAIGLCFRMVRLLVRVDALITPPVRGLRRFGKTFPWSRVQRLCQRPIIRKSWNFRAELSRSWMPGYYRGQRW